MDLSDCRDACLRTHVACLHAATHLLVKGDPHPRDQVRMLWDTADVALAAANLMSRGSPYHHVTCGACAVLCEACVEACSGTPDPVVKKCAEDCADCAKLCHEMATQSRRAA